MGRQFKIGDIPTSRILPIGDYHLRVASMEEAYSKSNLFMYKLEFRVVAPELCKDRAYYEYLVIGKHSRQAEAGASEEWTRYCELDDPDGEDPLTQRYSSGLRTLKQILVSAGHELATADILDIDQVLSDFNVKNPRDQIVVGAHIISKADQSGRENNEVTVWPEPDNITPALTSETKPATNKPARAGRTARTTSAPATPQPPRGRSRVESTYDEDELD